MIMTKLYCYYYTSSIQTTRHQNEKKKKKKVSENISIVQSTISPLVLNNRNHRRGRENRKTYRVHSDVPRVGERQLTGETVSSFAARRCFDSVISTSARVKSCVPFVHKSRSKKKESNFEKFFFLNSSDPRKGTTTLPLRQS